MKSAAKVFANRGLEQASIDEVAEHAGFTKGAFYANFKNKEELFLAMLDQRFSQRLTEIEAVLANEHNVEEQAAEAGADFVKYIRADPEWQRLFFEFSAYASRNPEFREELLTRYRSLRDRMAELFERRSEQLDKPLPLAVDDLTLMVFAMGNGVALEDLLEPGLVSEELYATMLTIFFTGLRALSEAGEAAGALPK
jgi:AcrR family transcriptional regulator